MKLSAFVGTLLCLTVLTACKTSSGNGEQVSMNAQAAAGTPAVTVGDTVTKIVKSNDEWRKLLTAEQYNVMREKGTEAPFTGAYVNNHAKGIYSCAACGLPLFTSDTKFESGTGWPSFWAPLNKTNVHVNTDNSYGMVRDEVVCNRCDAHLGHVFDDGPEPTGQRYCMNSVSLSFAAAK